MSLFKKENRIQVVAQCHNPCCKLPHGGVEAFFVSGKVVFPKSGNANLIGDRCICGAQVSFDRNFGLFPNGSNHQERAFL